jgi:hypothetical protein
MDRSQRLIRMIREIQLEGKTMSPDDAAEEAQLRAQLVAEIREIEARGGVLDIPTELP